MSALSKDFPFNSFAWNFSKNEFLVKVDIIMGILEYALLGKLDIEFGFSDLENPKKTCFIVKNEILKS